MNFKKVNQNISIDDFINGAEETTKPTLKPKEPKNNGYQVIIKLPKSLSDEIEKRVIKRNPAYSLKNFTKQFLLYDNQFLSDEAMIRIYQETAFLNIKIADFIKQKLGFIKLAPQQEPKNIKEKFCQKLVVYNEEEKSILLDRIAKSGLSMNRYNNLKIEMGLTTLNLFNQEEMEQIIKESSKANLSPKEYISKKILE